jgi:aryl-alcohol dehydrogenase-like predicted oxidoreductase
MPLDNRMAAGGSHGPATDFERLYKIVDALDEIAKETEKTASQIAINWLTQRPTVVNIIIGARNEEQLKQNLGGVGWNLNTEQIKRLDTASYVDPVYPYWHQRQNPNLIKVPNFYPNDTTEG